MRNSKAFTLVELIVVITILAILGTIAFLSLQGYASDARDSTRAVNVNHIVVGSELYQIKTGTPPVPDDSIDVTFSGSVFLQQGYVREGLLGKIGVSSGGGTDPLTAEDFIYSKSKLSYSVLAYLENGGLALHRQSFAVNTYDNKQLLVRGTDAGVVLNQDQSPILSNFEINTLTGSESKMIAYSDDRFLAQREDLGLLAVLNDKNLASHDESLVGYWPMEKLSSDNHFEDLSIYDNDCYVGTGSISLVDGFSGKSADLSNPNISYVFSCGDDIELNSQDFSISVYMKRTGYNPGYYENPQNGLGRVPEFMARGGGHAAFAMRSHQRSDKVNLEYNVPDPGNGITWAHTKDYYLIQDTWENFTYSYDSHDDTLKLYKDGVLIETKNIIINSNTGYIFYIVRGMFYGLLDEAKVFNRVLSDEEIKLLYEKYF